MYNMLNDIWYEPECLDPLLKRVKVKLHPHALAAQPGTVAQRQIHSLS
jgi:hypothetical protein